MTATPTGTTPPSPTETVGLTVSAPAHLDVPGVRGDLAPAVPAAPAGPLDPLPAATAAAGTTTAATTADPAAAPPAVAAPDAQPTVVAPPTPTPPAPVPAPATAAHTPQVAAAARHVVEEVARLAEAAGAGTRVARQVVLRLDPGALGEVHVRLRVHAGVVRVHLSAGDAAVRDRLAGDLGLLHDLLGTRADDVRVVVQDLPRGSGREATTTPAPAGEPPAGDAGGSTPGSSDGRGPGQQPGDAPPEHGRPTWMSAVTHATDGAHAGVRGPTPADPRATSPAGLDVSV